MTALFVVRADVADPADWDAFDAWYRDVHLPRFTKAMNADRARRTWSRTHPPIHIAYHGYGTVELAQAVPQSAQIKPLIVESDSASEGRMTRTRKVQAIVRTVLP